MKRNGLSHEEAGKLGALKSKMLAREQKRAKEESYYKDPKKCPVCQGVIPYDKRNTSTYCSLSCSASANNKKYPKRSSLKPGQQTHREVKNTFSGRQCPVCGVLHFKKRNKYCSKECESNKVFNNHYKVIEDTGMVPANSKGEANRKVVKRYLVEKNGHRCSICGITEWQGKPAPLVVDHIDGDTTNNKVTNFRLVCGNCDMQLPTYKSKNKTGREWRKKYYTYIGPAVKHSSPEVRLKCQWCGKEFSRRAANVPIDGINSDRFYSCSRSCGAHLSHSIQAGKYTQSQIEQMHKDNIISR